MAGMQKFQAISLTLGKNSQLPVQEAREQFSLLMAFDYQVYEPAKFQKEVLPEPSVHECPRLRRQVSHDSQYPYMKFFNISGYHN